MQFINKLNQKFNIKQINNLASKFNVNPYIIKHLFSCNIKTEREIQLFFEPGVAQFYNPFLLDGMTEAVKKINDAIANNKKIVIVGDYDTDGICATAILYKYFESKNVHVNYFLPNRFLDGYGLTIESVNKIIELYNPELIITVDCGIACYKEIDYILEKGIDIIVTDHHEIPTILPNCISIDPKKTKNYPFKELCGAGVALKLVQALGGLKEYLKYANIATIATVADIVPLVNENRAIVKHGLKTQDSLPVGVKKLLNSLKLKKICSNDISFKIAPKLNTAGRMGDASIAFKLFIETNLTEINKTISELENQNTFRVDVGNKIYEEAICMLNNKNISNLGAIVLSNKHWHSGVLGIVCAKLTEKFNRPVCLLSEVDGVYKGSIRSIEGIDIYKQLSKLSNLLVKFGGHANAGGLTIEEINIVEFEKQLNINILSEIDSSTFEIKKFYDIDINNEDVDINFIKQLEILEPCGFCNEKPIFKFNFNNVKPERIKNHQNYYKIKTPNFEILSFNSSNHINSLNTNCMKSALLDLSIDTYKNNEKLKGIIKYINYNKLNTNIKSEECSAYYLLQLKANNLQLNANVMEVTENEIETKITNNLGNLFVCNTFESYQFVTKFFFKYIFNYDTYSVKNSTGFNTLIFMPTSYENFNNYQNIFIFDEVITKSYLNNFKNNVYLVNKFNQNCLSDLQTDRKIFGIYHTAIVNASKINFKSFSFIEYFYGLKKLNPQFKNLKANQFMFVSLVLEELNIIKITNDLENYYIEINNGVNNPLNNSNIYNFVLLINKLK